MVKRKTEKHERWNVYLKGKNIDNVGFTGYTASEVKKSLIDHDGYDHRITVRRDKKHS